MRTEARRGEREEAVGRGEREEANGAVTTNPAVAAANTASILHSDLGTTSAMGVLGTFEALFGGCGSPMRLLCVVALAAPRGVRLLAMQACCTAVALECAADDAMLPGDQRFLLAFDESRAELFSRARAEQNGLLAQALPMARSSEAMPLLRMQAARRPAHVGSWIEVICIGIGRWIDAEGLGQVKPNSSPTGQRATLRLEAFGDQRQIELKELVRQLEERHAACRGLTDHLGDASAGSRDSLQPRGCSAAFAEPLHLSLPELERARSNALGRRSFRAYTRPELLSFVAASWMAPERRLHALTATTGDRLQLAIDTLREHQAWLEVQLSREEVS